MKILKLAIILEISVLILKVPAKCLETDPSYQQMPLVNLRETASRGNPDAILALGIKNDRDSIALLKRLASSAQPPVSDIHRKESIRVMEYRRSSFAAKAALTKMKVDDYFSDFIIEISTTNLEWKKDVIDDLGYLGDSRAVKYLGPLLLDDRCISPQPHRPCSLISSHAAEAMQNILQPPFISEIQKREAEQYKSVPAFDDRHRRIVVPRTHSFIKEWKQWWQENKDKYK